MICSMKEKELLQYVERQCAVFFPDNMNAELFFGNDVKKALDVALKRCEYCSLHICAPGYQTEAGEPLFSHLHSDQYATFLYFFSHSLWEISKNKIICDKLIYLNKALNGIWTTYKVNLPEIFKLTHPLGTILGHAEYSNYLVIRQGVTIASGVDQCTIPKIKEWCSLGAGATVLQGANIGSDVGIGVNTVIRKETIENNTVVYTDNVTGKRNMLKKDYSEARNYFKTKESTFDWKMLI